jgi:hypothetical protein
MPIIELLPNIGIYIRTHAAKYILYMNNYIKEFIIKVQYFRVQYIGMTPSKVNFFHASANVVHL